MVTAARFQAWVGALAVGAHTLRRHPVLGLKRLILPANYWRAAEFAYVLSALRVPPGGRVLDLGSPKVLAPILARRYGCEVVSTDIQLHEVTEARGYATVGDLVRAEVQDGRRLSYPTASFDAAYSVSVLEHIPGEGDSTAIGELIRVLKPGGTLVITVPYHGSYQEVFVDGTVYERPQQGNEPVFFERHYDDAALSTRLLGRAGASVEDRALWGESRIPMAGWLDRLGRWRTLLSPLEPLLSAVFLAPLPAGDGRPLAAFLTLRKPAPSRGDSA